MNILNQLYFLAISHLPASTVATISGALESAFNNNVKPEMKAIGNIIMYIISGVLIIAFVVKGVFVWRDYRHNGGEIQWNVLLVLFASSSLEEIYHYVYYQLTSVALTMLDDVNGLSINFFSNEFIQAIVNFFTLFAWGLGLTGAAIAIMDFAVSYQTGGGGSFAGTGMNMLRLLVALLTFSSIPILLFQTSMDIYGTVRSVVVGSMDGATVSITDLVKGAVQSMFKSVYGTLPPVKIANGIWEFLKKLTDGFQATDPADAVLSSNADWWALIQLIILVWAIFKIFFSNLKRGGILRKLVQTGCSFVLYCFCTKPTLSARHYHDAGCSLLKPVFFARPAACCCRSTAHCANVRSRYFRKGLTRQRCTQRLLRGVVGQAIRIRRKHMNDDQNYFFYPENLSEKALFFGWTGINLVIIAVGLVLSTLIFFFSFVWVPLLITLLYMVLTFTTDNQSLLKVIQRYINYLFLDQLEYFWGEPKY